MGRMNPSGRGLAADLKQEPRSTFGVCVLGRACCCTLICLQQRRLRGVAPQEESLPTAHVRGHTLSSKDALATVRPSQRNGSRLQHEEGLTNVSIPWLPTEGNWNVIRTQQPPPPPPADQQPCRAAVRGTIILTFVQSASCTLGSFPASISSGCTRNLSRLANRTARSARRGSSRSVSQGGSGVRTSPCRRSDVPLPV